MAERLGPTALVAMAAFLLAGSGVSVAGTSRKEIHLHVFLSRTCAHCELVEEGSLRRLSEQYECTIVPHYYDVDSLDEYRRLVALEERMGDQGNDLPVVVLGTHVLGGVPEIEADLVKLLLACRESGSPPVPVPVVEEAEAASGSAAVVRLAYFGEPGCRQCARVERVLELAGKRVPHMEVRRFSTRVGADRVLLEILCERAGVPEERRLTVPAVFVGGKVLIREEITDAALIGLWLDPRNDASAAVWTFSDLEREGAQVRLWERARNVSFAAVIAGGLVDGVNPCAFATLVFFVCCLAAAGRSRSTILVMGICFTLGVFAAYFLTGVGLSEALLRLDVLPRVSEVLTWGIIAATFLLAALSFRDFLVASRGDMQSMALKLPRRFRLRINALIARGLRARSVAVGALGLGIAVALIEFVCTGQVYLPLIRYMTTVSAGRLRGVGLLILYNLAFVAPLLAVFVTVYCGVSSERLLGALRRHVAWSKLLLTGFFLGLGVLLLHVELRGTF